MSGILVAGTTSDAGKSVVTTGLCRALSRAGVKVAPFKAQNMSNNSMVCAGPREPSEIGRAQWVQALAAGVEPEAAMNPVLLKPGSDHRSHVVLMGRPAGEVSAHDFSGGREHLAAMFGTVALLEPDDQRLVAGFVVNKFRGDRALLEPGLAELQRLTGRRAYGVLPWHPDLWLDSEDALDLDGRRTPGGRAALKVAVVRLPRISNFTDVDALGLEPGLDVVFVADPRALGDADLVVLPGTRATVSDLAWLRDRGLDRAVLAHAEAGRPVLGICGGFQMLGRSVADPHGVEGGVPEVDGLALLDVRTDFAPEKVLRLPRGVALGAATSGYEIHHGRVARGEGAEEFLGGARAGHVFGTMWHGSLEGDTFRTAFLTEVARLTGHVWEPSGVSFAAARERRLELLADLVEEHLDVAALAGLATDGVPAGLPILPPGSDR